MWMSHPYTNHQYVPKSPNWFACRKLAIDRPDYCRTGEINRYRLSYIPVGCWNQFRRLAEVVAWHATQISDDWYSAITLRPMAFASSFKVRTALATIFCGRSFVLSPRFRTSFVALLMFIFSMSVGWTWSFNCSTKFPFDDFILTLQLFFCFSVHSHTVITSFKSYYSLCTRSFHRLT